MKVVVSPVEFLVLWKFELLPCLTDEETLVLGTFAAVAFIDEEIVGPWWRSFCSLPYLESLGAGPVAIIILPLPDVVAWKLNAATFELSS